jgi:hypothetical protein
MEHTVVRSVKARRWSLYLVWAIACGGVGLQGWATLTTTRELGGSASEAVAVFLTYFTVLTNLLVVGVLTSEVIGAASQRRWRVSAEAAVAMYIAVVGLTFHTLLRDYISPDGAQRIASEWLHYVNPLLYVAWWLLCVEKGRLRWSDALWWLLYPGAYVAVTTVRGVFSGFYPYYFMDLSLLGYTKAALNAVGFTALFLLLGLVVVWVDWKLARNGTDTVEWRDDR